MSLTSYQAAPPRGRREKYAFSSAAQELFGAIVEFAREANLPFRLFRAVDARYSSEPFGSFRCIVVMTTRAPIPTVS
jgi:hypothetical protein